MLTLTENASTIVRDITEQTGAGAQGGLRISAEDLPPMDPRSPVAQGPAFAISAAEGPQPGDATVEQDGATIYLDAPSAEQLDDKVLDAGLDPAGNVQFALNHQG